MALLALALSCGSGRQSAALKHGVVSLVPSVTEIVYALGAGKQLVGNTTYCNYPEAAKRVYKVGDFQNPDLERIVALGPRLVFITLPAHQLIAEKLKELGIQFHVSRPQSIEEMFVDIDSIGILLGVPVRARRLVDSLKRHLAALPAFPDTPRVYLEISSTPLMSVGAGAFLNSLVIRAGGRNIFGRTAQEYPVVDPEVVVRADPEVVVILCPSVAANEIGNRLGWDGISAVRNGRVYDDLDLDILVRPGPRVVDGVIMLSRRLHQE